MTKLRRALTLARESPITLLGEISRRVITLDRFLVFSWAPSDLPELIVHRDISVRRFTNADLVDLHRNSTGRLKDQIQIYFLGRGIDTLYGFFDGEELVHTVWVYTAEEYSREPFQVLKLEPLEAELKHILTPETVRGRGYMPYALRYLSSRLFSQGFRRVYVTIDPSNTPSIRATQKAGLSHCGTVRRLYFHQLPLSRSWAYRNISVPGRS